MSEKPDLVVVGFSGELRILKLQARSLRLFAPKAFNRIHYVINEADTRRFEAYFEAEIVPELGPLAESAQLLPGEQVAGMPLTRMDWRSQQSLKLLAARHVQADSFLILDSKNHFIRPVTNSTFIADDGRMRTHRYEFNEKFRSKFENGCHYFGATLPGPDIQALPTATPFMMSAVAACDLIKRVETQEGEAFHKFFLGSKDYTEFYFYFAYLLSQPGLLDTLYVTRSRPQVTLFRSAAPDPAQLEKLLPVLDREDVHTFGVHRAALQAANPEMLAAIAKIWQRFGLVENEAEATYFLTPDKMPARRKWWQFWR